MIPRFFPRILAAVLALILAWPAPSVALRTQAGLESTEAESLATAFTGLEKGPADAVSTGRLDPAKALSAGGEAKIQIIEERQPAVDPTLWAGLTVQKKTVVIFGGLGRLGERFLRDGWNELRQQSPFEMEVIAVDRWDPDDPNLAQWVQSEEGKQFIGQRAREPGNAEQRSLAPEDPQFLEWVRARIRAFIQERMTAIGLPFMAYFPLRVFQNVTREDGTVSVNGRDVRVDGVIPAVFTRDHLSLAEPWIQRGVPVWMDKPIVRINEVDRLRQLARAHPRTVMGVDFFLYSDALLWLLKGDRAAQLLRSLGEIQRIDGRCCEGWGLEGERRPWLMVPELSGGTGLDIDTAVHPMAMMEPIIQVIGQLLGKALSLKDAEVTRVSRGRYADPSTGQSAPGTGETYFWMEGRLGNIPLYVDGGKGVDTFYYGATVTGTQGSLEVFVGTGEYDPYVKVTRSNGSVELHTFPGGSLGYRNIWLDFLLLLHGSDTAVGGDLAMRLNATTSSVEMIGKAERYAAANGIVPQEHVKGSAPIVPIKVLGQVASEMPKKSGPGDLFQRTAAPTGLEEGEPSPGAGGASLNAVLGGSSGSTSRQSPLDPSVQWMMAGDQVVKLVGGAFWSLELDDAEAAAYVPAAKALAAIAETASPAPFDDRDTPFQNVRVRYLLQEEALAAAPAFRAAGVRDFVVVITDDAQRTPLRALGMSPWRMVAQRDVPRLTLADDCRTLTTLAEAEAALQALVAGWPSSQTLGPLLHPATEATSKFLAAIGV